MSALSRKAHDAMQRAVKRSRPRSVLAADFWLQRTGRPLSASAGGASSYRSLLVPLSSLPLVARLSCSRRDAELAHELREVVASLSRPARPLHRSAESVALIVDAIMRGY